MIVNAIWAKQSAEYCFNDLITFVYFLEYCRYFIYCYCFNHYATYIVHMRVAGLPEGNTTKLKQK